MTWFTKNKIVYEDSSIRLLEFRKSNDFETTMFVPPQSGQESWIVDFDSKQSLVECAIENTDGGVYSIEWKNPDINRALETIDDLQDQVIRATKFINSNNVHAIGLSQGGWLTALSQTNHNLFSRITIAGSPIDTSYESSLSNINKMPLSIFQYIVFCGGGVLKGDWLLKGWSLLNPTDQKSKNEKLLKWKNSPQNLSGGWYLWAMENVFINNRLPSILNISCQTNIIVGLKDDLVPPKQTIALQKNVNNDVIIYEADGDHIDLFIDKNIIKNIWIKLFNS